MIEEQNMTKPATERVEQVLTHMLNVVRVNAVFGQPVERGNTTIIPCSEVTSGVAIGSGIGPLDEKGNSTGSGSGGGGAAKARPIAAIVISQEGVHVEPIMDITKVALATITTGAFVLFWLGRLFRLNRRAKGPSFKKVKKALNV